MIIFNLGEYEFLVKVGDRIAQLVFEKISPAEFVEGKVAGPSERGAAGFGSTGVSERSGEAVAATSEAGSVHAIVPVEIVAKDPTDVPGGKKAPPEPRKDSAVLSKGATVPKNNFKDRCDTDSDSESSSESASAETAVRGSAPGESAVRSPSPPSILNNNSSPSTVNTGEPLLHASQEQAEKTGARSWNRPGFHEVLTKGQKAWLDKLRGGDTGGVETPASSFVNLRGEALTSNPRTEESYKQGCIDICG